MLDLNDPEVIQQLSKVVKITFAVVVIIIFASIKVLYNPKTKRDIWQVIRLSLMIGLLTTGVIVTTLFSLHYAYIRILG